jgi:hypothetical protein
MEMTPRTAGVKTLQAGTLNLNTSGTLDLADNDLVVDAGSFTTIQAAMLAGFGTSGPGIISSTSDGSQILALFDNSLVGRLIGMAARSAPMRSWGNTPTSATPTSTGRLPAMITR